jgi:hypothetical protein
MDSMTRAELSPAERQVLRTFIDGLRNDPDAAIPVSDGGTHDDSSS